MPDTRQQGRRWERAAERLLRRRGLRILARNYECRSGEIDLIMLDGAALVFVEVRYRRNDRYGSGADTVTRAKQLRIITTARQFLTRNAQHAQRPCRFDVVSVGRESGQVEFSWIQGAFDAT
jgi:putative endonuclease